MLDLVLEVLALLNTLPSQNQLHSEADQFSQRRISSRFKEPFTEGLMKNTENLQKVLRRSLFRCQFSADQEPHKYEIILQFFTRIETCELLDKNLAQ